MIIIVCPVSCGQLLLIALLACEVLYSFAVLCVLDLKCFFS